ncbi:MAG: DNA primase small subunit domain-containing protein [Candidatus Woesearchaeota archaeon]|nr:DNA primase small subunit domain-containing protein [Candidatus Woesearchaeota archaeon]
MIDPIALFNYYKRPEIQREIIRLSKDREVAVKFSDKGFGKRPDALNYASDVIELVKQGATSFHASEELWKNPLQLEPTLKRSDLDKLRIGWDLVIDIDCEMLDYSKIAADLVVKAIKHHGIKNVNVKFSGNHGFHIALPFESFPEKVQNQDTKTLFPDGPRKMALYLEEMIKSPLAKAMLKKYDINEVAKQTKKSYKDLVKNNVFNPFEIIKIDTLLISSRHLFRMPYCFNEKSGLISVPVDPDKILEFDKEEAKPENVKVSNFRFLDKTNAENGEAKSLIVQAFDFGIKKEEQMEKTGRKFEEITTAIPEQFFPPCIKLILKGVEDGRKRSLFVLVNFLTSAGWDYEKIEELLRKWNKNNREELREVYLIGQVRYHKQQKKKILPPNCINKGYYLDIGVCKPDELCKTIKNPVNYAKKRARYVSRDKKEQPL